MLWFPTEFDFKAEFPIAALLHPIVLDCKEPDPIAVLKHAVVLARKAY